MRRNAAVFGIFQDDLGVKSSINQLNHEGFSNAKIRLYIPRLAGNWDIERLQKTMLLSFAKIGALIGGASFTFVGFILASGLNDGVQSVPLPFLVRLFFLLFTVFFGVIFGAAAGALIGIGTPQPITHRFSCYIDAGATLLSVKVKNSSEETAAKESFEACGARDIARLDETLTWASIEKTQDSKLIFSPP